jgi:hypothetical protein
MAHDLCFLLQSEPQIPDNLSANFLVQETSGQQRTVSFISDAKNSRVFLQASDTLVRSSSIYVQCQEPAASFISLAEAAPSFEATQRACLRFNDTTQADCNKWLFSFSFLNNLTGTYFGTAEFAGVKNVSVWEKRVPGSNITLFDSSSLTPLEQDGNNVHAISSARLYWANGTKLIGIEIPSYAILSFSAFEELDRQAIDAAYLPTIGNPAFGGLCTDSNDANTVSNQFEIDVFNRPANIFRLTLGTNSLVYQIASIIRFFSEKATQVQFQSQ